MTTAQEFIEMIADTAAELDDGLDAGIEFGICDGDNLQLIDNCDIDIYSEVRTNGSPTTAKPFIVIRGHHHPGEGKPGKLLRGVAADADEELRRLTDDSSEDS